MSEEGLVEGRSPEAVFTRNKTVRRKMQPTNSSSNVTSRHHAAWDTDRFSSMLDTHRRFVQSRTIGQRKDVIRKTIATFRNPKDRVELGPNSAVTSLIQKTCRSTNWTTIKINQEDGTHGSLLPDKHHHLINWTTPSIDGNNNSGQQYRRITTTNASNKKRQDNVPDNALLPARSERSRTRKTITFAGREPLATQRDFQFNDAARTKEHIWTKVSYINFVEGMAQLQEELSL